MGHHEGQQDESLLDKVKNALGMGDDEAGRDDHDHADGSGTMATDTDAAGDDDRADGWAGVPGALYDDTSAGSDGAAYDDVAGGPAGNPGPAGSARYENTASYEDLSGTDVDASGGLDSTREDARSTEFGGAYGEDDTAMPTAAAYDRGEPMPAGEASFGGDEGDDEELDRRGTGI